jgi:hypothetical protein
VAISLLYSNDMETRTIPGWQLPYLRIELILRTLARQEQRGGACPVLRRERAQLENLRAGVARAGWFN